MRTFPPLRFYSPAPGCTAACQSAGRVSSVPCLPVVAAERQVKLTSGYVLPPLLIRIPLNSCTVGKAPPVHPYRGIRIFSYSHPLGLNLKLPDSIGIRIRA